jgi:hypothetical protein
MRSRYLSLVALILYHHQIDRAGDQGVLEVGRGAGGATRLD